MTSPTVWSCAPPAGGGIFRRIEQPDLKRSLASPETSSGIRSLRSLNEDLTLLDLLCEVEGRPSLPSRATRIGRRSLQRSPSIRSDIARPPSGCVTASLVFWIPLCRGCWTSVPCFAHRTQTQSSAPSIWIVFGDPCMGAPHSSHCISLANNFIFILTYIII